MTLHIVTVCTGNTCRSPMAEMLLAHALDAAAVEATVESVGTLGWNERGATSHAVDAMAERSLDLSAHRSRTIADAGETVPGADLVLAMTRIHAGAIVARHAHLADRTFLPGEFVRLAEATPRAGAALSDYVALLGANRTAGMPIGRASDEIEDPAGEDRATYDRTAERLEGLATRIANHLSTSAENTLL